MTDYGLILKLFDKPDEVRTMTKGRFELITIHGQTFGRATYQPGWRWSKDVGPERGLQWCPVEHLVYVISGASVIAFPSGEEIQMLPGSLFYVPPVPHDSWVLGNEPYMSLHILGAEGYAK